jgi:hypothetical protein
LTKYDQNHQTKIKKPVEIVQERHFPEIKKNNANNLGKGLGWGGGIGV